MIICIIIIIIIIIICVIAYLIYNNNRNNNTNNNSNQYLIPSKNQFSNGSSAYGSGNAYGNGNAYGSGNAYGNGSGAYGSGSSAYGSGNAYGNGNDSAYGSGRSYGGSIDNNINEINNNLLQNYKYNVPTPINLKSGHPDLKKNANKNAPKGNPFNRTNISAPYATPIMVKKELNADTLDFDEKNANFSLMRNDPYRPINGIMNRDKFMEPFLLEELKSEENKEWWGVGEY